MLGVVALLKITYQYILKVSFAFHVSMKSAGTTVLTSLYVVEKKDLNCFNSSHITFFILTFWRITYCTMTISVISYVATPECYQV